MDMESVTYNFRKMWATMCQDMDYTLSKVLDRLPGLRVVFAGDQHVQLLTLTNPKILDTECFERRLHLLVGPHDAYPVQTLFEMYSMIWPGAGFQLFEHEINQLHRTCCSKKGHVYRIGARVGPRTVETDQGDPGFPPTAALTPRKRRRETDDSSSDYSSSDKEPDIAKQDCGTASQKPTWTGKLSFAEKTGDKSTEGCDGINRAFAVCCATQAAVAPGGRVGRY
jgi:hypothetical protein